MAFIRQFFSAFWLYFFCLFLIALGSACFETLTEYQVKAMIDQIALGGPIPITWLIACFVVYKFLRHFVFF